MGKKHKQPSDAPLPTKDEILNFIQEAQGKVGKREIARAFHIKGGQRIALKRILKEMAEDGLIEGNRKTMRQPGTLANVAIIEITGQDAEGDYYGKPARWDELNEGPAPLVLIGEGKSRRGTPPGIGDRVLSNIEKINKAELGYAYMARPIKVLPRDTRRLLGIYKEMVDGSGRKSGEIQPIDKKQLKNWHVSDGHRNGAQSGELVSFEIQSRGRTSLPRARIIDRLGNPQDQGLISLIAIETHGIPHHFPDYVMAELQNLPKVSKKNRDDMRDAPFITIDPADARDHDDAVWAMADESEENKGGHIVYVAIADVSFYVRPSSGLDKEALKRGNSVYFPDRVVPMLPELISNDLCSLREGEDRPALAVKLVIDNDGKKTSHQFQRILMRSKAKLSYNQAQAAIDGKGDEKCAPLLDTILKPLWAAYEAVKQARLKRAPLELDMPERKILMNEKGEIKDIITPDRLDAHKLIEEFMIQANVAAAETLEKKRSPLLYRVHDTPSDEKVQSLKEFLSTLELSFGSDGPLLARSFNSILSKAKGKEWENMVTEVVLRSQSQAEYSAENYGHFGLNLSRYAHFTSPIRRYADLIVHRSLVRAVNLGEGGLTDEEIEELDDVAQQISDYERRAMVAERETVDRLVASYLESKEDADFKGRIAGVTRAGLFVKLDDTGADGFIPISTLGSDYFIHDEDRQALVGERTGETFHLGQRVDVKLVEIIPTAGAIRFEMISDGIEGSPPKGGRTRHGDRAGRSGGPRSTGRHPNGRPPKDNRAGPGGRRGRTERRDEGPSSSGASKGEKKKTYGRKDQEGRNNQDSRKDKTGDHTSQDRSAEKSDRSKFNKADGAKKTTGGFVKRKRISSSKPKNKK